MNVEPGYLVGAGRGQQAARGSVCSGVRLREAHRRCGAFVGVGAHGGSRDALGIMGSWLGGCVRGAQGKRRKGKGRKKSY